MKVFIACLGTETNTFSPIPTGLRTFEETMLYRGDATRHTANLFSAPLHAWRELAEAEGGQVIESLAAFAQPAGPTVQGLYEAFRDEILADLGAALPVDMVLFSLHGAMVAGGYDDCEGDLLGRTRALVGPKVAIGAEFDLHCSITPAITASADAIVTFKEYPHIDSRERGEELYRLCRDRVRGTTKPVIASHDCRMISTWRTPIEPMASFVQHMKDLEGSDGILSVSFAHGFPWGDVAHASAKTIVVADGDVDKAAALAAELGDKIWAMRHETAPPLISLEAALDEAQAASAAAAGPVVLADDADNAGGGAPSDATFVLEGLLARGLSNVASGLYWDPTAVRFCQEAGEGASLDLRIGGKCCRESGRPVDLTVTVKRIVEGATQPFGQVVMPIGDAVWVQADNGLDLVLNTLRTQVFHPDAFSQMGIALEEKAMVVVKSSQHFYAGFAPIAAKIIYIAGEGTLNSDYATIPYVKFTDAFWPRVADPFAEG